MTPAAFAAHLLREAERMQPYAPAVADALRAAAEREASPRRSGEGLDGAPVPAGSGAGTADAPRRRYGGGTDEGQRQGVHRVEGCRHVCCR